MIQNMLSLQGSFNKAKVS